MGLQQKNERKEGSEHYVRDFFIFLLAVQVKCFSGSIYTYWNTFTPAFYLFIWNAIIMQIQVKRFNVYITHHARMGKSNLMTISRTADIFGY